MEYPKALQYSHASPPTSFVLKQLDSVPPNAVSRIQLTSGTCFASTSDTVSLASSAASMLSLDTHKAPKGSTWVACSSVKQMEYPKALQYSHASPPTSFVLKQLDSVPPNAVSRIQLTSGTCFASTSGTVSLASSAASMLSLDTHTAPKGSTWVACSSVKQMEYPKALQYSH